MAKGKDVFVSGRVTRAMEVYGRMLTAHAEDAAEVEKGMRYLADWAQEDSERFIPYSDDAADWLMGSRVKITVFNEMDEAVALGILDRPSS